MPEPTVPVAVPDLPPADPAPEDPGTETARPAGRPTGILRLLSRNKPAMVGLVFILMWTVGGLLIGLLGSFDPNTPGVGANLTPPNGTHLFGTDNYGRDVFTRVLYGARLSLWTGLIAVAISLVIGVPLGALAGFVGGKVGNVIMRLMDMLLAFPQLVLAMAIAATLGPGMSSAMIAVGIVGVPEFARIMYGQAMSLRQKEFVEASRAIGLPSSVIIRRHIVPNALAPILVRTSLGMGYAILTAASLSFIGLGAQPPTAEWGVLISDGRGYIISGEWWMTAFPGLAIATSILGFNLLGDGLRDVLDPRLRTSR